MRIRPGVKGIAISETSTVVLPIYSSQDLAPEKPLSFSVSFTGLLLDFWPVYVNLAVQKVLHKV